jgi:hypothetical protein
LIAPADHAHVDFAGGRSFAITTEDAAGQNSRQHGSGAGGFEKVTAVEGIQWGFARVGFHVLMSGFWTLLLANRFLGRLKKGGGTRFKDLRISRRSVLQVSGTG